MYEVCGLTYEQHNGTYESIDNITDWDYLCEWYRLEYQEDDFSSFE